MLMSLNSYAANYYWVGGSGDWSDINHWVTTSGGTTKHIQTPTANDNVFFDANSMSSDAIINLNSQTIFCKNFDAEGITHKLTFSGICQVWKIYGGFKLHTNFYFNIIGLQIHLEALSGAYNLKSNGKQISSHIYFLGNATWKLLDKLDCNNVYLNSGIINTNSQDVVLNEFISISTSTRGVILGSSEIHAYKWQVNGAGFSANAGTSYIHLQGNSFNHVNTTNLTYYNVKFYSFGYLLSLNMQTSFHKVIFTKSGNIGGNNTFDSLIFTKKYSYNIAATSTQTINQALVASGDCKEILEIITGSGFSSFLKLSGTISCDYVTLKNIHATGGASFYDNGGIDLGGNTGWHIQAAPTRNLYWVGNNGEWSDTNHWSLTSGGQGGECIPTTVDNVIIDTNSFASALNYHNGLEVDIMGECHDFTWETGVSGLLKIKTTDTLFISGSSFFGDSLRIKKQGSFNYISNYSGETIETSNIDLNAQLIEFSGLGGWTLLDSLKNKGGHVYHFDGHLNTGGQYVHSYDFYSSGFNAKELSLGNSTIDIDYKFYLYQDSLTLYPNTSQINFIGDSAILETIGPHRVRLYNVTFFPGRELAKTINDDTRFNKIKFLRDLTLKGHCVSDTLYFEKGYEFIFHSRTDSIYKLLSANGNCNKTITMRDIGGYNEFFFKMGSTASVSVSYVNMRGSHISGISQAIALNCGDVGMNTNWIFNGTGLNHYWIGGQGNWQDPAHWSYSSGGQGGACIPTINDNVFFDANSFSNNGDTVSFDSLSIFCKNFDWTGATHNPVFYNSSDRIHFISGSIKLINNMDFLNYNNTSLVWTQNNKTIDMEGQVFNGQLSILDTGAWSLLDTLVVLNKILHFQGKLIANQYLIQTYAYISNSSNSKTLDIHNDDFELLSGTSGLFEWVEGPLTHLISNLSHIKFLGGGLLFTQGTGQTAYYNVSFLDSNTYSTVLHGSTVTNSFNRLLYKADGGLIGENTMDTLIFSKGKNYYIQGGFHQYITHEWIANADCYGEISITGLAKNGSSSIANINKTNGNVLLHSVKLKNVNAIGNVSFSILDGYDLGGNSSNWQIIPTASRTLYWVNDGGSWFDTAHWSLSSGGKGGECIPTYKDDVYFDNSSFSNATDTAKAFYTSIECHNLIWRWTPVHPTMNLSNMNIYGSMSLGDTLNVVPPGVKMYAIDTGNFIRTSSHMIDSLHLITNGGWYLMDTLHVNGIFKQDNGIFRSMRNTIYATDYITKAKTNRILDIRNSELFLKDYMYLESDSLNFLANGSTINFKEKVLNPRLLIYGHQSLYFNNVLFSVSSNNHALINNTTPVKQYYNKASVFCDATILGENVFDSLIFQAGHTYKLEEGITQYVKDYWLVRGNNCYALNLQSTKKNNQAYVTKKQGNVSGDFINMRDIHANGGAQFYAGNFSTDISNNSGWSFSNGPQYVYGLGPSVNFNLGGTVTLSTTNFNGGPNTSYLWSNGSTSPSITVNKTGWYYVTVTYAGGCIVRDSIFVGCNLKMKYNITDNLCNGDSLGIIHAVVPDTNYLYLYQWSTGDTLDYTDSLFAGIYTVMVSADSGLCTVIDTLTVSEPPPVICPQGDTAFCVDDSVLLDLGSFVTYKWSDNYTQQLRWILQPDTFVISVEDKDGCWSVPDTISIREDQRPIVNLGPDTTICLHESILLDAGSGMDQYLWSDNSAMSNLTVYYTGKYWVRVKEKTCVVSDTIELLNCPPKFIVPNVFTPNGDGFNDVFKIDYQNIWEFEVKIYDRWGVKVYQSKNLDNPWNGKVNGRDAAEGVYFWQIIYQEYNGKGGGYEDKMLRGTVTLFREAKY